LCRCGGVGDVKVGSRSAKAEKADSLAPLKYRYESEGEAEKFSEYAHSPGSRQLKEGVREVRAGDNFRHEELHIQFRLRYNFGSNIIEVNRGDYEKKQRRPKCV
jgi:hypothetical protein